jgi:BlaR1 peptidase M56
MADFMGYGFAISLLFAFATLGAEQVCALYRSPRRFLWALALVASLAFPLSMSLAARPSAFAANEQWIEPVWLPDHLPSAPGPTRYVRSAPLTRASGASGSSLRSTGRPSVRAPLSLDGVFKIGWLALSIALLAHYGLAWLRLRRTIALAPYRDIDGVAVRVTHDMGPAVFGLIQPQILIPQWILEAPAATRSLALEHERAHISAGDPVLLFVGSIAVVLVPWNPALWWMLRRLRFSIEADCDARVLRSTADPRAYAQALLTVSEHRALLPTGSVALTSPKSWLERRVRIMLAETNRLSRVLAVSGSVWAVAVLGLAVLLHAPPLAAQGELRKLPPQAMKPATRWVQSLARARYPELFDPSFHGMAVVTMLLKLDGSLVSSRERAYHPQELPRAESQQLEAQEGELALDPGDILYSDVVDLRPLVGNGTERAIGYISYAILKWPHDPLRAQSRIEAAVKAYYPELTAPGPRDQRICTVEMAVLMNEDGSVRDAHRADEPCDATWSADQLSELNSFGTPQEELGRGGHLYFTSATNQGVFVRYTWPRQADDPPNVQDLSSDRVNATLWTEHPPLPDTHDDAAIIDRYFGDIEAHGGANLFTRIDGRRYVFLPWILFGRDGTVWGTGRSPVPVVGSREHKNGYVIGPALGQEIEARYPGIRTWGGDACLPRVHGVLISCFWISPDSPVQRLSDVAFSRRKDLLVITDFQERSANPHVTQPLIMSFADAMNFGTPAGTGRAQWFDDHDTSRSPVTTRLIATRAGAQEVDLELQIRRNLTTALAQSPADQWVQAATMRIPYGSGGTVDVFATNVSPPQKVQIILRPELLHDLSDSP